MIAFSRWVALCTLLLITTAAIAQTPAQTPRATDPVTAETDKDLTDPRALKLTLDGAVKTAMEQNLGIGLQKFEYLQAGHSLRSQHGIFDWFTTAEAVMRSSEAVALTEFESSSSRSTTLNFGVQQLLPTGGSYDIGFDNSRTSRVGRGTSFSPAYGSGLTLFATQPFLRNFGVDITRRGIYIARNTLGINQELFRTVLMDTALSVEQAYLDLAYARRNVEVVKESLFLARDQSRITQIRIDVGASAPLDILQPRVQIATTEEQLIIAVAGVRAAEDRLRALMNLPQSEWDRPIVPVDPVEYRPVTIDIDQAVARALELRPEIKQALLTTDTRRIQYNYARNQVLPRLDMNLGYGATGLGGRVLDPNTGQPVPGIEETGYTDALEQVLSRDFPQWSVGVSFGLPILNIGARAEAKRAELDFRQSEVEQDQTEQTIAVAVRQSARDVDTAARSITASTAARDAAERNLEAERRRFENGMTTNFNVLQVQQQLADARVRELRALVGYNQAVASYHRAVGDLLEFRNIAVQEPERIDEPTFFSAFDRYNWLRYDRRISTEEPKK